MSNTVNTANTVTSTRGPGRPRKALKLILTKSFSLKDIIALNPGINKLTIRNRILEGVESGQFTKLSRAVQTGQRGKPAHLYINTRVFKAAQANLAKSRKVATATPVAA